MRKNLAVDIPKDAETEVDRIRGLKKSIFTRTRIATLCLVMVLGLSVSGTLAFESWVGNTTPNRGNWADVDIHIVEEVNGGQMIDENASNVSFGYGMKKVKFKRDDLGTEYPDKLRVSFVPEMQKTQARPTGETTGSAAMTVSVPLADENTNNADMYGKIEDGTQLVTDEDGNVTNGVTSKYIRYGNLVLWLNSDELTNWSYENGAFTYTKGTGSTQGTLSRNEETGYLLMGVDWADNVKELAGTVAISDAEKQYSVKLNVILDAIQYDANAASWS